jgi:hypothetical protein
MRASFVLIVAMFAGQACLASDVVNSHAVFFVQMTSVALTITKRPFAATNWLTVFERCM